MHYINSMILYKYTYIGSYLDTVEIFSSGLTPLVFATFLAIPSVTITHNHEDTIINYTNGLFSIRIKYYYLVV